MRTLMIAAMVVLIPALANAQADEPRRGEGALRWSRGMHVAVIDADSREWQGRLLEVARDAITVEIASDARRFSMTDVKRIDAHGDRIWDGALKGAAFGGVIGLPVAGPRFATAGALSYGLLGLGLDALNSCTHTVYRAPAKAAGVKVSW